MNIRQEGDYVKVDDWTIEGTIVDELCQQCGSTKIRYDQFDAYFCAVCNQWLEEKCDDADCRYCRARPNQPLPPASAK